jgi:hypothetical protein
LSIEGCFLYIRRPCLLCVSLFIAKWYGITTTLHHGRLSVQAFMHDSPYMLHTTIYSHIFWTGFKIFNYTVCGYSFLKVMWLTQEID